MSLLTSFTCLSEIARAGILTPLQNSRGDLIGFHGIEDVTVLFLSLVAKDLSINLAVQTPSLSYHNESVKVYTTHRSQPSMPRNPSNTRQTDQHCPQTITTAASYVNFLSLRPQSRMCCSLSACSIGLYGPFTATQSGLGDCSISLRPMFFGAIAL